MQGASRWLSNLHISIGRKNAGSSVPALASLFLGRLSLSGHKAKPLPNYHDNIPGIGGQAFKFDAEYAVDKFVPLKFDRRFEGHRQRTPIKSNLVRADLNQATKYFN